MQDIVVHDYVIVEGTVNEFSGTGTLGNSLYHGGCYVVTADGETVQVKFEPGVRDGFPDGEFYGTVVYGKHSRYLLDLYIGKTRDEAMAESEILQEYKDDLIYE